MNMKKLILAVIAALVSMTASAQYVGTLPPNVDGNFTYTKDSDDFETMTTWIGLAGSNGFGARIGYSKYKQDAKTSAGFSGSSDTQSDALRYIGQISTDSDFSASGNVFQLTYVNVGENHDFQGAIGTRQVDYKYTGTITTTVLLWFPDGTYLSDSNKYSETATVGGRREGDYNAFVGNADLRLIMTDRVTIGASVATDIVESPGALMEKIRYVYTAVDADYVLSEAVTFNAAIGNSHFSGDPYGETDGNNRVFIRTATTWSALPQYGVSFNFKTRNQHDTDSGSPYYFSPERLSRQTVGVMMRKYNDGLVYIAGLEGGQEQITNSDGSESNNTIYGWRLGIETNPARKSGVTYGVSLIGTNAAVGSSGASNVGGGNYDWYSVNFWLKAPL